MLRRYERLCVELDRLAAAGADGKSADGPDAMATSAGYPAGIVVSPVPSPRRGDTVNVQTNGRVVHAASDPQTPAATRAV